MPGLSVSTVFFAVVAAALLWREVVWWRKARNLQFSRSATHTLTVPPGPDGRPGETIRTHSLSAVSIARIGPDGSRGDCTVMLSRHSLLLVVCLGPVAERGTAEESARKLVRRSWLYLAPCIARPKATQVAGTKGVVYKLMWPHTRVLKEYKFEHDGWLYAVGILRFFIGGHIVDRRAEEALASWAWLDADEDRTRRSNA